MSVIEHQLLADMKDLFPTFKCTIEDLRDPKEDFVTNFYSYWLQEFEVDINNITQVQFSQSQIVNAYQDAYSGIIPKLNLLKSIRSFEVVPEFGMLDIVSPTPRRTQTLLRAFINFYLSADQHIALMRDKKEDLNERKVKLLKVTEQREELRETLNSTIKNIGAIQDEKNKLEEETLLSQQKTSELRMEKEVLKLETREMSNQLKEKETALQKIDKEDAQVSNKIKEYSNMIVDSPSSFLSDLEVLRHKQQEMNELSDQKRDMVEFKMQSQNKLVKLLEDQQLRAQQLEEILKLIEKHRELLQTVSSTEKYTTIRLEELNELKSQLLALSNKKQNHQELLQSLLLKWKTLKPQLTEDLESVKRDLIEKKNEKNKIKGQLEKDAEVQESIDSLKKKIKIFVKDLEDSFNKLRLEESELYDKLESSLKLHMENEKRRG